MKWNVVLFFAIYDQPAVAMSVHYPPHIFLLGFLVESMIWGALLSH
jgi:hypothetical protein